MGRALVITDMQEDFMPWGTLPVPRADEIIAPIAQYAHRFEIVVVTRDWHPPDHASFKENGGPWARHCVADTPGAELVPAIAALGAPEILKGMTRRDDGYNAFDGTIGTMEPEFYFDRLGVEDLTFVGVAQEVCVEAGALGGRRRGFTVRVPLRYTRPITPRGSIHALSRMIEAGVRVS